MEKLYRRFGTDIEFLAVNLSFKSDIEKFVKKYGLTFPVAYDEGSKVASLFNAKIETNILIDRNGVITFEEREFPTDIEKRLEDLTRTR